MIQNWADCNGITLLFIQPGKPQENAYVEQFNRTVRYELLNQKVFDAIEDVQLAATRWQWKCNHSRSIEIDSVYALQRLVELNVASALLPSRSIKASKQIRLIQVRTQSLAEPPDLFGGPLIIAVL